MLHRQDWCSAFFSKCWHSLAKPFPIPIQQHYLGHIKDRWMTLIFFFAATRNIGVHDQQIVFEFSTAWWFGTFFIFPYIGNFIIPIDELIFFRGVFPQLPTRAWSSQEFNKDGNIAPTIRQATPMSNGYPAAAVSETVGQVPSVEPVEQSSEMEETWSDSSPTWMIYWMEYMIIWITIW